MPLQLMMLERALNSAARAIFEADALIVFTGAGMGVDSGLGTYRGANSGVWKAGHELGFGYDQLCRSQWLSQPDAGNEQTATSNVQPVGSEHNETEKPIHIDARLAWAFWRFQYELYTSRSEPHDGYRLIRKWGERARHGLFAVTSNVDGHWLRTLGEDSRRVYEIHGSVRNMQIIAPSPLFAKIVGGIAVWPAEHERDYLPMELSADKARIAPGAPLPTHPQTDNVIAEAKRRNEGMTVAQVSDLRLAMRARPNVLMFGDKHFDWTHVHEQHEHFNEWKESLEAELAKGTPTNVVVLEIGAGQSVRTIKDLAESELAHFSQAIFVRINYCETDGAIASEVKDYFARSGDPPIAVGERGISIVGLGALEALRQIDERIMTM